MEIDERRHQKRIVPLLVVEHNPDHQLVIGYCLRTKIPQAEPLFARTDRQATFFLNLAWVQQTTFPQLVILDPFLPTVEQGLGLLTQIRTRFPQLPVILLSGSPDDALIKQALGRGAHAFWEKPRSLEAWESLFQRVGTDWFSTVSTAARL